MSSTASASATTDAASVLVDNAALVRTRMAAAALASTPAHDPASLTLVAVSKTKPASDILHLYSAGHRNFGENYFQELIEKAAALPPDIKWHFIGHLQSQKAAKLVKDVPNLFVVETVDSAKLAKKLHTACEAAGRTLQIYIQVDTSGEDTKSGVPPPEVPGLIQQIMQDCPALRVSGLMTIGAPGDQSCFDRLAACRIEVATALGVTPDNLALSMGMSGDFPEAIARGATSVRVGSTIFGERQYAPKA